VDPAHASVSVNATLGKVDVAGGQITGALTLSATNEDGLSVDNLRIAEGSDVRMLRRLVLTGVSVEYTGGAGRLDRERDRPASAVEVEKRRRPCARSQASRLAD
jgi:hypothetical protein